MIFVTNFAAFLFNNRTVSIKNKRIIPKYPLSNQLIKNYQNLLYPHFPKKLDLSITGMQNAFSDRYNPYQFQNSNESQPCH